MDTNTQLRCPDALYIPAARALYEYEQPGGAPWTRLADDVRRGWIIRARIAGNALALALPTIADRELRAQRHALWSLLKTQTRRTLFWRARLAAHDTDAGKDEQRLLDLEAEIDRLSEELLAAQAVIDNHTPPQTPPRQAS